jgi:hypothetical protein
MPHCRLVRQVPVNGHLVRFYRAAILLSDGDRFTVYCPADDNELIRGATQRFIDGEVAAGRLEILS